MQRFYGFTLIELMVVIAIASILMLVAVPSFQSTTERSRVEAVQKDLIRDIALARQEAASRNRAVSLCKSDDGATCSSAGDWNQGWIMFLDTAGGTNGVVESGEEILRVHDAIAAMDDLEASNDFLRFSGRGGLDTPETGTPVFAICTPDNNEVRGVLVTRSGRAIGSRRSGSTDYVQVDSSNNPIALSCS